MILKKGSLYKVSKNRTMFGLKTKNGIDKNKVIVLNQEEIILFLRENFFYHIKNNKILVASSMLRESPKDYLYLLI